MCPCKWFYVSQGNAATCLWCGGKLIWIFFGNLSLFAEAKKFTNQSRLDKVIAMVRLAQFF